MFLLIFLTIYSTCFFQLRLESIIIPRYVTKNSRFNSWLSILRCRSMFWALLCGGWKRTKLDFLTFNDSLLTYNQVATLLNSSLITACRSAMFLCSKNKLASSVNKWKSNILEHLWISFIYSKNKSGPRTDPWGTPQVISQCSDWTLLTVTNCFLPLKYDTNQLFATPLTP